MASLSPTTLRAGHHKSTPFHWQPSNTLHTEKDLPIIIRKDRQEVAAIFTAIMLHFRGLYLEIVETCLVLSYATVSYGTSTVPEAKQASRRLGIQLGTTSRKTELCLAPRIAVDVSDTAQLPHGGLR